MCKSTRNALIGSWKFAGEKKVENRNREWLAEDPFHLYNVQWDAKNIQTAKNIFKQRGKHVKMQ